MHSKVRERTKETAPVNTRRAHGEAVRQFSAFCSETGITILPSRIRKLMLTKAVSAKRQCRVLQSENVASLFAP